jgi:hypothetical protein
MKRRMTKEKESEEPPVQSGASGEELTQLTIVEEATPANPAAQEAVQELTRTQTPLEKMAERVSPKQITR